MARFNDSTLDPTDILLLANGFGELNQDLQLMAFHDDPWLDVQDTGVACEVDLMKKREDMLAVLDEISLQYTSISLPQDIMREIVNFTTAKSALVPDRVYRAIRSAVVATVRSLSTSDEPCVGKNSLFPSWLLINVCVPCDQEQRTNPC